MLAAFLEEMMSKLSLLSRRMTKTFVALALAAGVSHADAPPKPNSFWWPDQLDLSPLRAHAIQSNPLGADFDYAKSFTSLNLEAVKADLKQVLTTSQDWWPADYGNYGPFFIRMAWHSAGTYRAGDGRGGAGGGQQRFDPLNSWPDNANLDKARRLLWPVKQKYGQKISWGDLMVLAGNVSLEAMGFKTFGYAGGRPDDWEPDLVYWGPEKKWLADERHTKGKLEKPLGAVQMGLIYVNPQGPNGNPDPIASAKDIREAFGRMQMNDEETVALIAGGHTFGKTHGAHPASCVGAEPAAGKLEDHGIGWKNKCGTGTGPDAVTSGLEGAWTMNPIAFTNDYIDNLLAYNWVKTKSPAGAIQWIPEKGQAKDAVPDAFDPKKSHPPVMLTTDLALKMDPEYRKVIDRFHATPDAFRLAFAKAWFKLTHRDMGPRARYLGPDAPKEVLLWQDPLPAVDHPLIDANDVTALKAKILAAGISVPALVRTTWASASSFRGTDMRGGANGARVRLAPQKTWAANSPTELATVLGKLEQLQTDFNRSLKGGKKVSFADVVVLVGDTAIEQAAKQAGVTVQVPFHAGRTDATQDQTDPSTFAYLEPTADGFRNFYTAGQTRSPAELLVDKANMLNLTVPEMTVLVGGLRVLDANTGGVAYGVFTRTPGVLTNDFFVQLLDMSTKWTPSKTPGVYEGHDRKTDALKWTATPVDLIFGSSSELRAVAEVYAESDGKERFVRDFVKAWTKVTNLDRFDVK